MDFLTNPVDFILHVDTYLGEMIRAFGGWTYVVLFSIIFAETGLVVTPFLPGDSLLFAAGAFADKGEMSIWLLFAVLFAAAVLGDTANYAIGHKLGPKVMCRPDSRVFKREYLDRTNEFFERYGGKTVILARFVPIVRTFAPFMAGVGAMTYGRFLAYNVVGALLWVSGFLFAGYFFGSLVPDKYFTLVILAIILISVLPGVWHWAQHKLAQRRGVPAHPGPDVCAADDLGETVDR